MNYHTHTLFGFVVGIAAVKILSVLKIIDLPFLITDSLLNPNLIKFYTSTIIGALIPDIDHIHSKAGRTLWFLSKPLKLFGISHRGFTHSILGFLLFSLLTKQLIDLEVIDLLIWLGLIIGYLSHLLADMLNVKGLPLFYPNKKRIKFYLNIPTNSWQEHLLFFIVFTLLFFFLLRARGFINFSFNLHDFPELFNLN